MLVRVARDKALPFEPLIPNLTTLAAMEKARRGGLVRFDSVAASMADLDADDGMHRPVQAGLQARDEGA
ncbi:hypothetical protein [Methylobacterium sp. CM6246]